MTPVPSTPTHLQLPHTYLYITLYLPTWHLPGLPTLAHLTWSSFILKTPTLTFLLSIAICTDLFWNIWHVYHHYVVLSYTSPVSKTNTEVIPLSMRMSSSMSDPWHIFGKCGGGFCFFPLCSQIPAALLLGPSAYLSVVTCYFPFGQRFPEMTVEHRIVAQIKC